MAKQKLFSIKKEDRVFGGIVDGVALISNRHWMARQELVGITVEMAVAMETKGHFTYRDSQMKPDQKPPCFENILGSFTIPELFPVKPFVTLNDLTVFVFENTLFKGIVACQTTYLPLFDKCQAYRSDVLDPEKPIRFYRDEVLQGVIMPMRWKWTKELIENLHKQLGDDLK